MAIVGAVACGTPSSALQAEALPADSLRSAVGPVFVASSVDTITNDQFISAFSLSLDDFLVRIPGYFVERHGPLGADAAYSRYGFGRRRGAVLLGKMLLNDPYDGRVPLAVVPETAVGELVAKAPLSIPPSAHESLEGVIAIKEPEPISGRPATELNISTGGRGIEERRVRFSSASSRVGIDLNYDELRSDGYYFDARDSLLAYPRLGSSVTRNQGLSVRGELTDGDSYRFQFRRFTHSFQGDIQDAMNKQRRSGEYGLLTARVNGIELASYVRGYRTNSDTLVVIAVPDTIITPPDSLTRNQTVGFAASFPIVQSTEREVRLGWRYEDVTSRQTIGGTEGRDERHEARIGLDGVESVSGVSQVYWSASLAHQFDLATGWNARVGFAYRMTPRLRVVLEGARSSRMPTLDEQFLPSHDGPEGVLIEGNRELGPEIGLEGSLRSVYEFAWGMNETRISAVRMIDPILPVLTSDGTLRPVNSEGQGLYILDNRFRVRHRRWGFETKATASVEAALGDREGYFDAVAPIRLVVVGDMSRTLFKGTSELRLVANYQYSGERRSDGHTLDPYGVLDLALELRLLSARAYVRWINVLDERYETTSPYLMMPSTIVYGIWWTLFD